MITIINNLQCTDVYKPHLLQYYTSTVVDTVAAPLQSITLRPWHDMCVLILIIVVDHYSFDVDKTKYTEDSIQTFLRTHTYTPTTLTSSSFAIDRSSAANYSPCYYCTAAMDQEELVRERRIIVFY